MQDDNQQPQPTAQPTQPSSLVNSGRVIQPVSDMSEYVKQDTSPPVQLTQTAQPAPNSGATRPPVDPSKIYPNITPTYTPANTSPNTNEKDAKAINNQRVATRVPTVQIYAFLIIIYSAYSVLALSSIFHTMRVISSGGRITTAGTYSLASPLLLLVFGIAAVNLVVGIYLLIAKNIKTVNALLTALLIIGGLGLLNSIVSTAQVISHINASTIVSLFVSAGLLMYLWHVKSQVDLAAMD